MQMLYNMIVKSQKQEGVDITKGGKIPKHKYEYDSDEDTEGGTWEHKLRQKEMAETAGYSQFSFMFSPEQLETNHCLHTFPMCSFVWFSPALGYDQ